MTTTSEGYDLLILLCGDTKNDDHREMPALCRYLGPVFSTLRAELRLLHGRPKRYPWHEVLANVPNWLDIYIVSGVYGLLHYDTYIPWYDSGGKFSKAIQSQVLYGLSSVKKEKGQPDHLAYVGGKHPIGELLRPLGRMFPESHYRRIMGTHGVQAHGVKEWIDHCWWHRTGEELVREYDYKEV